MHMHHVIFFFIGGFKNVDKETIVAPPYKVQFTEQEGDQIMLFFYLTIIQNGNVININTLL